MDWSKMADLTAGWVKLSNQKIIQPEIGSMILKDFGFFIEKRPASTWKDAQASIQIESYKVDNIVTRFQTIPES